MYVLCLCLHHVEDNLVPFPHALRVRGADVVLHDDLPLPPTQPAPHEALHLEESTTGQRCIMNVGGGRDSVRKCTACTHVLITHTHTHTHTHANKNTLCMHGIILTKRLPLLPPVLLLPPIIIITITIHQIFIIKRFV